MSDSSNGNTRPSQRINDLCAELDLMMLSDDPLLLLEWHSSLSMKQRTDLQMYALEHYLACLERIAKDFKRHTTRGKKQSNIGLLRNVACSYLALHHNLSIQRVWSAFRLCSSKAERDRCLNNPDYPLPRVSNQPKMVHFSQDDDYHLIEQLWANTADAKQVRAMFDLGGRKGQLPKPTKSEFIDLFKSSSSRLIKRAKRTTFNT